MTSIYGNFDYLLKNQYTRLPQQNENYKNYFNEVGSEESDSFVKSDKDIEGCTDGQNDGEIKLGSKIWNALKGAGKTLTNIVKTAVKNPVKTALGMAVCAIPFIGPIIGAGFATVGLVNGVKTISNGIKVANNAKTDAEAKAAWQNIGSGSFTTVASAIALKGSGKLLKDQMTGGSATINGIRNGQLKGSTLGETIKNVVKSGAKETFANIRAIGTNLKQKFSNFRKAIKNDGGIVNYVKNLVSKQFNGLLNKIKNYKTPATRIKNAKALATEAKMNGGKVVDTYRNGVPKKVVFGDGRVMEFSKSGVVRHNYVIKTNTSRSGKSTETVTVDTATGKKVVDGKRALNGTTTRRYNETTGANGIVEKQSLNVFNSKGVYRKAVYGKTNTNSGSGYTTEILANGDVTTTYTINNQSYNASQLNPFTKAIVRFDANTNILNAKMPISDATALYTSTLIDD